MKVKQKITHGFCNWRNKTWWHQVTGCDSSKPMSHHIFILYDCLSCHFNGPDLTTDLCRSAKVHDRTLGARSIRELSLGRIITLTTTYLHFNQTVLVSVHNTIGIIYESGSFVMLIKNCKLFKWSPLFPLPQNMFEVSCYLMVGIFFRHLVMISNNTTDCHCHRLNGWAIAFTIHRVSCDPCRFIN